MLYKHFRHYKDPLPSALTWEEKNPTDYLYHETEAVKRLEKTVEELQKLAERESKKGIVKR